MARTLERGNGFYAQRQQQHCQFNDDSRSSSHSRGAGKKGKHHGKSHKKASTSKADAHAGDDTSTTDDAPPVSASTTTRSVHGITSESALSSNSPDVEMPDAEALTAHTRVTPAAIAKSRVTEDRLMTLLAGLVADNPRGERVLRNMLNAILDKEAPGPGNNDVDADGDNGVELKDADGTSGASNAPPTTATTPSTT